MILEMYFSKKTRLIGFYMEPPTSLFSKYGVLEQKEYASYFHSLRIDMALGIMIDTRCILALAGALYSLFVISNLYILSRFSDAILMYFPIFFINSSHPINEQ